MRISDWSSDVCSSDLSKFSGRDENSNNITFGPALDQGRLQHPGLLGQMVDVPSDRLALPKVATHPRPHATRTIGAPCIDITSRLNLMRSIRPAKERRLGKVKHQRISPARRWRRKNCDRLNRNGARPIGVYCY